MPTAIKFDRKEAMARYEHNKKVYETGEGEYLHRPSIPENQKINIDFSHEMVTKTASFFKEMEAQA